jgi:hypothetical protein
MTQSMRFAKVVAWPRCIGQNVPDVNALPVQPVCCHQTPQLAIVWQVMLATVEHSVEVADPLGELIGDAFAAMQDAANIAVNASAQHTTEQQTRQRQTRHRALQSWSPM